MCTSHDSCDKSRMKVSPSSSSDSTASLSSMASSEDESSLPPTSPPRSIFGEYWVKSNKSSRLAIRDEEHSRSQQLPSQLDEETLKEPTSYNIQRRNNGSSTISQEKKSHFSSPRLLGDRIEPLHSLKGSPIPSYKEDTCDFPRPVLQRGESHKESASRRHIFESTCYSSERGTQSSPVVHQPSNLAASSDLSPHRTKKQLAPCLLTPHHSSSQQHHRQSNSVSFAAQVDVVEYSTPKENCPGKAWFNWFSSNSL